MVNEKRELQHRTLVLEKVIEKVLNSFLIVFLSICIFAISTKMVYYIFSKNYWMQNLICSIIGCGLTLAGIILLIIGYSKTIKFIDKREKVIPKIIRIVYATFNVFVFLLILIVLSFVLTALCR